MQNGTLLAAVDLGSNSFRLEIGRFEHGHIQRVEYRKETVRQGNGLDAERHLTPEAMQRGWDCLARFAERLAAFGPAQVRAVATQTLREALNRDVFLQRASSILGHTIEVVSGPEEARLIYQGVARLLPQSNERRLVVDIGGRSTELILGQQYQANTVASLAVGSVAWSARYFADGSFTPQAFSAAEVAAKAVLEAALEAYPRSAWDVAYGSSGTVSAVGEILAAAGQPAGRITLADLDWLQERLLRAQSAERVRLEGLKEDRRPVIGGGISVLRAVFELLQIDELQVAQGALRQGALYDLVEREQPQTDLRAATVRALMQRFGVDSVQAERVRDVAASLWRQLRPGDTSSQALRDLEWAAQLHEVGCRIAHSDYHRHGAYILEHTDAAGFGLTEMQHLALLVLGHRGKLKKIEAALGDAATAFSLLCLRLAVALCHARRDPDVQALEIQRNGPRLVLNARAGWAAAYPQSAYLLREEVLAWQKAPWELVFNAA